MIMNPLLRTIPHSSFDAHLSNALRKLSNSLKAAQAGMTIRLSQLARPWKQQQLPALHHIDTPHPNLANSSESITTCTSTTTCISPMPQIDLYQVPAKLPNTRFSRNAYPEFSA
jgi:hypothetical protein